MLVGLNIFNPSLLYSSTKQEGEVVGFEKIKDEYSECPDFGTIYADLSNNTGKHEEYILQEGYLFKGTRLCVPQTSHRDFLIWELHAGGLAGHFRVHKTTKIVEGLFFGPT